VVSATVVVLSRQPDRWLAPCLASAVDQADRVVLVDNGSEGAEASRIGAAHGVEVVRAATNLGFAGGVNLALDRVRTDLVALLNDDAVAGPDWIRRAATVLEDAGVAAVTPKVRMQGRYREVVMADDPWPAPDDPRRLGRALRSVRSGGEEVLDRVVGVGIHELEGPHGGHWRWTAPGRPFYVPVTGSATPVLIDGVELGSGVVCRLVNKAGSYLRTNGALGDVGAETPDDGRWDEPAERFFSSGTALVARTATWRRIGGLADPFFAYYEDGDWSWRARLAGLRHVYDPGATVDHLVSATSGGGAWVQRLALRNRALCAVRNAPARVALDVVRATLTAGPLDGVRNDVLRRLPWALTSRRRLSSQWVLDPDEVWDRWAGADTTWDDGPVRAGAGGPH
jgi:GT2 family glycosyltransferase